MKAWLTCVLLPLLAAAEVLVHDTTRDIKYKGVLENSIEKFKDVRYGLDTSGPHRFAPPRHYEAKPGSRHDNTKEGYSCPQDQSAFPPWYSPITHMSEDCLNLLIARPPGTDETSNLPVLVWLHGGGGIKSSPYDPHYDPSNLIQQSIDNERPVLYVGVSYRLGFFGFARTPLLAKQKSLNAGLRDQRLAFEWIKSHIKSFGGDPSRITAFGQSAGGSFIGLHQLAHGGKQATPFDRAFMLSGPAQTWLNQSSTAVQLNSDMVAKRLDCDPDVRTAEETLSCMRKASTSTVLSSSLMHAFRNHPPFGVMTFTPTVDGDILPDRSSELLRKGLFTRDIPTILAWTQDDGSLLVNPPETFNNEEDVFASVRNWAPRWTFVQRTKLFSLYPVSDFEAEAARYNAHRAAHAPELKPRFFQASRISRDILFTCPSFYTSAQLLRHASREFDSIRLFSLNQTAHAESFGRSGVYHAGVSHCADIPYVFAGVNPDGEFSASDRQVARLLSGSLLEFAYTGNPVSGDDRTFPEWPVAHRKDKLGGKKSVMPSQVGMVVVGGEYGSSVVSVPSASRSAGGTANEGGGVLGSVDSQDLFGGVGDALVDGVQQAMEGIMSYTSMGSRKQAMAQRQIEEEMLIERCAFLNGFTEMLGV